MGLRNRLGVAAAVRAARSIGAGVALAICAAVATAGAADGDRFELEVTVASISDRDGKVDPKGQRLDGELRKQFRYTSLEVLDTQRFRLKLDEIGSLKLPDGKRFSVRPMNLGERGLLMSVEWTDTVMMDMNAKSGHLLVIGGPEYRGGKLVIGVEPRYDSAP